MTKPKLANNCFVKTVVCVKNPGPIAEVAIKKAAPVMTDEIEDFLAGWFIKTNKGKTEKKS